MQVANRITIKNEYNAEKLYKLLDAILKGEVGYKRLDGTKLDFRGSYQQLSMP